MSVKNDFAYLILEQNSVFSSCALISNDESSDQQIIQFLVATREKFNYSEHSQKKHFPQVKQVDRLPQCDNNSTKWLKLSDFMEINGFSVDYSPIVQKLCDIFQKEKTNISNLISYNSILILPKDGKKGLTTYHIKICDFQLPNYSFYEEKESKTMNKDTTNVHQFGIILYEMLNRSKFSGDASSIVFDGWLSTLAKACIDSIVSFHKIQDLLNNYDKYQFPYNFYRPPIFNQSISSQNKNRIKSPEKKNKIKMINNETLNILFIEQKGDKLNEHSSNPLTQTIKGKIYLEQNQLNSAISFINKAYNQKFSTAIYYKACILMNNGESKDAIQILQTLIPTDIFNIQKCEITNYKQYVNGHYLIKLGCFYQDIGEKEKARKIFEIGTIFNFPESFNCLAILEEENGNIEKAIENLQQGIDIIQKFIGNKYGKEYNLCEIQIFAEMCRNLGFLYKKKKYPPSFYLPYFENARFYFPNNYYVETQQFPNEITMQYFDEQVINKNKNIIEQIKSDYSKNKNK